MSEYGMMEHLAADESSREQNRRALARKIDRVAARVNQEFGEYLKNAGSQQEFAHRWKFARNFIQEKFKQEGVPATKKNASIVRSRVARLARSRGQRTSSVASTRQVVTKWDYNNERNAFVSSVSDSISCPDCSSRVAGLGMNKCSCGTIWNFLITAAGDEVLGRKIEDRSSSILASRGRVARSGRSQKRGLANLRQSDFADDLVEEIVEEVGDEIADDIADAVVEQFDEEVIDDLVEEIAEDVAEEISDEVLDGGLDEDDFFGDDVEILDEADGEHEVYFEEEIDPEDLSEEELEYVAGWKRAERDLPFLRSASRAHKQGYTDYYSDLTELTDDEDFLEQGDNHLNLDDTMSDELDVYEDVRDDTAGKLDSDNAANVHDEPFLEVPFQAESRRRRVRRKRASIDDEFHNLMDTTGYRLEDGEDEFYLSVDEYTHDADVKEDLVNYYQTRFAKRKPTSRRARRR